ncbi:TPA: hypothetical protein HA244_05965 [Candidatus Micrarchaeota archaeon]|nr:hypothetical protein [Candidatus Micrarchaeota archaeon]
MTFYRKGIALLSLLLLFSTTSWAASADDLWDKSQALTFDSLKPEQTLDFKSGKILFQLQST